MSLVCVRTVIDAFKEVLFYSQCTEHACSKDSKHEFVLPR